jgi:hypothetical protein
MIAAIDLIWRQVFENAGEDVTETTEIKRCPGESCKQFSTRFPKTQGRWKDRAEEACAGCGTCDGNIPRKPQKKTEESSVEDMVSEVADLITWENAGIKTAWEIYPFETALLFKEWRKAELEVSEIRQIRMQAFLRGWMSEAN